MTSTIDRDIVQFLNCDLYNKTFVMCKHKIHKIKRLDRAICPWFWLLQQPQSGWNYPLFPSFSLSSSLAFAREGETFHLAVIGMELSKVLNLFISIMCICVCVYVYDRLYALCVHRTCMYVCMCICLCMLLSVYNTFTIITIRCSSMTIHLNSRMYMFIFIIFIYIIRKKV